MNVSLSPEEYRKLVELAYLGEWLINAHHDTEYQDDHATAAVQRLLEAGPAVTGVGRDEETGEYFLQADWVEQLYDTYIADYDDHVFWDELTERLAARDLARDRGVSPDDIIRDDDLLELRPLEDQYRQELEEHGVERLEIKPDF
jgi:hypothetical protein